MKYNNNNRKGRKNNVGIYTVLYANPNEEHNEAYSANLYAH